MSNSIRNKFMQAQVDFYYTAGGVRKRDQVNVSASQDPNNLPNQSFFQGVLERRYPGAKIEIISVNWL